MISAFSLVILAQLAALPADVKSSIDTAIATNDTYVIDAVIYRAKNETPQHAQAIEQYLYSQANASQQPTYIDQQSYVQPAQPVSQPIESYAPASGHSSSYGDDSMLGGWEGNVEGGLMVQTGNSENENLNGAFELKKEIDKWTHTIKASAANNSSDDVRSAEEYRASVKSDYGLSPTDYVFGEIDAVKDRYSGYEYRVSEYLGYGHKYYNTDELKLSAEAGLGLQQSQPEGQDSENNFVQKIAGDLEWAINENLTLEQELSVEHASGVFFSISDTALRTKISEELALKVGYNMEHISDVPPGTEKLDTKATVNVLYEFK